MLKPLLTLLCSCAISFLYAQGFRYSFAGNLSVNELSRLNDSLEQLPIVAHRIQLKSDQELGEVYFEVEGPTQTDSPPTFSPLVVKRVLLAFGLLPLNCVVQSKTEEP